VAITLEHRSPTLFFVALEARADWFGHSAPYLLRSIARQWDLLKSKGDQRAIESLERRFLDDDACIFWYQPFPQQQHGVVVVTDDGGVVVAATALCRSVEQ
jgi:hypothetical protein